MDSSSKIKMDSLLDSLSLIIELSKFKENNERTFRKSNGSSLQSLR